MIDPLELYYLPPIPGRALAVGDLLRGLACGRNGFWVVLTPSCDFAQKNADFGLLAACEPLNDAPEYKAWKDGGEGSPARRAAATRLKQLFRNRREKLPERYYFLPGLAVLPHLVVDFQQTHAAPIAVVNGLTVVASLRELFAGAVVARFIRYFGRVGTPDLNVEKVLSALT